MGENQYGQTLADYGITRDSTVHLVLHGEAVSAQATPALSPLGSAGAAVLLGLAAVLHRRRALGSCA